MFIIRVLFLMFSYFSVFDKIWCTFFPCTLLPAPVGHRLRQKRHWFLAAVFCCGMKPTCSAQTFGIMDGIFWKYSDCIWTSTTYTDVQLHHLSYLIGGKLKLIQRRFKCFFQFIANMTLCSPSYLSFVVALHY